MANGTRAHNPPDMISHRVPPGPRHSGLPSPMPVMHSPVRAGSPAQPGTYTKDLSCCTPHGEISASAGEMCALSLLSLVRAMVTTHQRS